MDSQQEKANKLILEAKKVICAGQNVYRLALKNY
jgi:hypothetical protein